MIEVSSLIAFANVAGNVAMQMAAKAPRHIVGTTADVVAGERVTHPVDDAIVLDLKATDKKFFKLLCDVTVRFGTHSWTLCKGFRWNGADIHHRVLMVLCAFLGISPYDPRIALASGFHDDVCNQANADGGLRAIGDAIFISLLMPITFNGVELPGIGAFKAAVLYAGVRAYSVWRFVRQWLKINFVFEFQALLIDAVGLLVLAVLSYVAWWLWL